MSDISPNSDSKPGVSASPIGVRLNATYEQLMSQDLGWALTQGSLFFEGQGRVQETLTHVTQELEQHGIAYAIMGGMALYSYGFRRYTENIDVLVTLEDLHRIHRELIGRGFAFPFQGSKNVRDANTGVKIQFWITSEFPGDALQKAFVFPDPRNVVETRQGVKYVNLATLVELKLASGIYSLGRTKDIGDVEEMIRILNLPEALTVDLDPFVSETYEKLWQNLRVSRMPYLLPCRCDVVSEESQDLIAVAGRLARTIPRFLEMKADGIELDRETGIRNGYCYLYTHDRTIAAKYGMIHADEFLEDFSHLAVD